MRHLVVIAAAIVIVAAIAGWALPVADRVRRGASPTAALAMAGSPWMALAGVAGGALLLVAGAGARRRRGPTTHGSARLADARDLADLLLPRPGRPSASAALPAGALLLAPGPRGRAYHLPARLAARHVLVDAPTGNGKTRGLVLPNCAAIRAHSFVCADLKSEAWAMTGGLHERAIGYAPRDPAASHCFNFIPACADPATATLLAEAALQLDRDRGEQLFWRQSALVLCAALFAHAATTPVPTPATAYNLLDAPDPLGLLARSPAPQARRAARALGQADERVRASVVLDVQNRLSFLDDPAVRRFTSAELTGPDFRSLRERPTAIYWRLDERDLAALAPLSAIFWTLLLDHLTATAGLPVTLILDEFANLGRLPRFETTISVARGRAINAVLVVQSVSQLAAVYGRDHARTIRACCLTKLTLGGGLDAETAEGYARLAGEATVVVETASRRPSRGGWPADEVSRSEQHVRRPLLTADEVRRLPEGAMLAIVANRPAARLPTFWHDAEPAPGRASGLGPERGLRFDAGSAAAAGEERRPLRLIRSAGEPAGEEATEWPL